jgi:hypothetical protein
MIQQAGNAMQHSQAVGLVWLYILSQVKFQKTDASASVVAASSSACSSVAKSFSQPARIKQRR